MCECRKTPEELAELIVAALREAARPRTGEDLLGEMAEHGACPYHIDQALRALNNSRKIVQEGTDGALPRTLSPKDLRRIPIALAPPKVRTINGAYDAFLDEDNRLGVGSMGVVVRGIQKSLGRDVAIKLLRTSELPQTALADLRRRFLIEPKAMSQIHHPNVVQVIDCGEDGDLLYYVMELLPETLAAKLKREGPFPASAVHEVMFHIAGGLAAALEKKIRHRDVKPANMFPSASGHKIGDFGLLKYSSDPEPGRDLTTLTREHTLVGTLPYIAPEVAEFKPGDHRSDIYSLGISMYELATGRYPFNTAGGLALTKDAPPPEWLWQHIRTAPIPLTQLRSDFPPELAQIINRTVEKRPENRYQNYKELIADLKAVASKIPRTTTSVGPRPTRAATRASTSLKSAASSLFSSILSALDADELTIGTEYEALYGPGCLSTHAPFIKTLYALAKEKNVFDVCVRIHARANGLESVPDFETRYLASLNALENGQETGDDAVPLDFRTYIWTALQLASDDKAKGLVPDTTLAEALIRFLKDVVEDPALIPFQVEAPPAVVPPSLPSVAATGPSQATQESELPTATRAAEAAPPEPPHTAVLQPAGPADFVLPAPENLIGRRVNQFEVLALLGKGGMGTVFRARDTRLDRDIALKVLHPEWAKDAEFVQRFLREGRNAAQLDHPNAVTVHEAGSQGNIHYIAMQLVKGRTLHELLVERRQFQIDEALRIVRQAAEALRAAHQLDLIHRDIKPNNIMIAEGGEPPGRVKLMDFGLMRSMKLKDGITQAGDFFGTPEYASPEQAREEQLDGRTDIYSLGVVLYEMLAGFDNRPFGGATQLALLRKIGDPQETPVALRERSPEIPAAVASLVAKMTAKRPEERFASAGEVVDAIDKTLGGLSTGAPAPPTRNRRRRTALLAGAAAAMLLAIVGAVLHFRKNSPRKDPAVDRDSLASNEVERHDGAKKENPDKKTNDGSTTTINPDRTSGDKGIKEDVREIPHGKFPPTVPTIDLESSYAWVKQFSTEVLRRAKSPGDDETIQGYISSYAATSDEIALIRSALAAIERRDLEIQGRNYSSAMAELARVSKDPKNTVYTCWIVESNVDRLKRLEELEKSRKGVAETTFYAGAELVDQIYWRATHSDPALAVALLDRAVDPSGSDYQPGALPHVPGLVHAITLRAIASIDPKDTAPLRAVLGSLNALKKVLPERLQYALLPCGDLGYEIEAAEALGRNDLKSLFLKFERSRFVRRAAEQLLRAFRASLIEDELVGEVEDVAWQRDLADAPRGKITLERNPERYCLSTAGPRDRAWLMKQFKGAKQGYQVRWRFAPDAADETTFVISLYSRSNPEVRRWIEITSSTATLCRSDEGTVKTVSTARFPKPVTKGSLTVLPAGGVTLLFVSDQLQFALDAADYPLDEGMRLGAAGSVFIESIRVVNRD